MKFLHHCPKLFIIHIRSAKNKKNLQKESVMLRSQCVILAFVKRLCKSFYRQNDLQNRFTENSESSDYDGGKNNPPL